MSDDDWFARLRAAIKPFTTGRGDEVSAILDNIKAHSVAIPMSTSLHCPHCGEEVTALEQRYRIDKDASE